MPLPIHSTAVTRLYTVVARTYVKVAGYTLNNNAHHRKFLVLVFLTPSGSLIYQVKICIPRTDLLLLTKYRPANLSRDSLAEASLVE